MTATPASIAQEMREACEDFHRLLDGATTAELRKQSEGTRWTNDQLLFHMLLGYLVVRTLLWLVRAFSTLPEGYSRRFAQALNAAARPFHVINYLGSLAGARVLGHAGMKRVMDRVTDSLTRTVTGASERELARSMHFPVGWDPYFKDSMSVQDVLHYGTQHYRHHRGQLTLGGATNQGH